MFYIFTFATGKFKIKSVAVVATSLLFLRVWKDSETSIEKYSLAAGFVLKMTNTVCELGGTLWD